MLGAVLEYMAWSSYINVVPVYYNVALKSKYMQDSASWEMLDKIYSGIYIDAGVLYTKVLSSVHQLPRKIVTDQVDTTASRFKQMKAPVEASLKRLQEVGTGPSGSGIVTETYHFWCAAPGATPFRKVTATNGVRPLHEITDTAGNSD
ncbi:MAG: hypothetical protein V8T53_06720 [Eubacteriales bacterium]